MGPPDKREPKPSSDVFEYTYTNTILPAAKDLTNTIENSIIPKPEHNGNTKSVADNQCLVDTCIPDADSHKSVISSREVMPKCLQLLYFDRVYIYIY